MSEEELTVEIAEIDCVEIDDVNFTKARQGKVLEQFAANAAGADEKDARLLKELVHATLNKCRSCLTCLIALCKVPSDCLGNLSRPIAASWQVVARLRSSRGGHEGVADMLL